MMPFRIPKHYYADICRETTNWVLITERIMFRSRELEEAPKPFEILPCASKYLDFELPESMRTDMYYMIMRSQARLAGWDKSGFFDILPEEVRGQSLPEKSFPMAWPMKITAKRREAKRRDAEPQRDMLLDFAWGVASKIFPPTINEPGFKEYVAGLIDFASAHDQDA